MFRHISRVMHIAHRGTLHGTHCGVPVRLAQTAAVPSSASTKTTPTKTTVMSVGDGPNHRCVLHLDAHTIRPQILPDTFIAPSASIIGSVAINSRAAVMYGAVVRGDLALIHIGFLSVVGENAVLTAGRVDAEGRVIAEDGELTPADAVASGLSVEPELFVGDFSTIGANATVHGAYLDGDNIIGDGASVGDGVRIGRYGTVLGGSWVADGTEIGEGEIWGGSPAVKVGEVSDDDRIKRRQEAMSRHAVSSKHAYEFLPVGTAYWEKEQLDKLSKSEA